MANAQDVFLDDLVTKIPMNMLNSKQFNINVRSYAGQAPFNSKFRGELFYWFFESQSVVRPKDDLDWQPEKGQLEDIPLLIWINGGPGGSSEFGLFSENGPLRLQNDAACSIVSNPNSWNQKAHVIYWDQPVGTGYSRSLSGNDYVHDEIELRKQFYQALQCFYARHPEYRNCKLYITGESYAGKYIPHIATEIMEKNKDPNTPDSKYINLAGLAIGDGWMDPRRQLRWVIDYAFNLGFLDSFQKKEMEDRWDKFNVLCERKEWHEATEAGNCLNDAILACGGQPDMYDIRHWSDTSGETLPVYMNVNAVKDALHIPTNFTWITADNTGPVTEALIKDNMKNVTPLFLPLLDESDDKDSPKYQLLFYTGNFDMSACGFTGTERILQDLKGEDQKKWEHQEEWNKLKRKVWVSPPFATNGFVKSFANLTQVVIPGAGHLVPINKPVISREMLYTWLFNKGDYACYEPLKRFDLKHKKCERFK
ncbi:MAG: S10 family peptidase [Gammaproteobacteria bacterium]|nr:S10 family peptidase [Gammaproteobacteria bacterium]